MEGLGEEMEWSEGRGGRDTVQGRDLRQDGPFPRDKQRAPKARTNTSITIQMFQQPCVKENKPPLFMLNKPRKHKPDL